MIESKQSAVGNEYSAVGKDTANNKSAFGSRGRYSTGRTKTKRSGNI